MSFSPVTHVIFDLDGLLLDTERLFFIITQKILDDFGKTYTFETKRKLLGKTALDTAKGIIEELELPITPQDYLARSRVLCEEILPSASLLPGVERLVQHLHRHKIPLAIASSSSAFSFQLKTKRHRDFFKVFDPIVLAASDPDVANGKPAPDVFLVCTSRFKEKPSCDEVLVFEDSALGVEAALLAGMQVVMVPDPVLTPTHEHNEIQVLSSLCDFRPEEFGLPPYESPPICP